MLKTKLEIIQETADFYSADTTRRATYKTSIGTKCNYLTMDGKMCAAGRCMVNPEIFAKDNHPINLFDYNDVYAALKPKYRQQDIDFWKSLQSFHDTNNYWDDKGLTAAGNAALNALKTAFA